MSHKPFIYGDQEKIDTLARCEVYEKFIKCLYPLCINDMMAFQKETDVLQHVRNVQLGF